MKKVLYLAFAIALSVPVMAQSRGKRPDSAPPVATSNTSSTTHTTGMARGKRQQVETNNMHRRTNRHHSTHTSAASTRSNKGGAERGQTRAAEVHKMNATKRSARDTDHDSDRHGSAGRGHGRGKK